MGSQLDQTPSLLRDFSADLAYLFHKIKSYEAIIEAIKSQIPPCTDKLVGDIAVLNA